MEDPEKVSKGCNYNLLKMSPAPGCSLPTTKPHPAVTGLSAPLQQQQLQVATTTKTRLHTTTKTLNSRRLQAQQQRKHVCTTTTKGVISNNQLLASRPQPGRPARVRHDREAPPLAARTPRGHPFPPASRATPRHPTPGACACGARAVPCEPGCGPCQAWAPGALRLQGKAPRRASGRPARTPTGATN